MPRLSIFIPVYNAEKYIAKTIDSVLAQTYTDWELIIVEDKSADNSLSVIKQYEAQLPSKIKVYRNESNLGMLENWNKGIDLCRSELFVKLDADDIWLPGFLEKSIAVLDKYPDVGLVFTKYVNIDEEDTIIPDSEISLPDFAKEQPFSTIPLVQLGQERMLSFPILRQGLSVMRRAVFDSIGKYRFLLTKETQAATDTEFYFRTGLHYHLYCINETLYQYRVHQTSISRTDTDSELSNKKIAETKTAILNYYAAEKKISPEQYNRDISRIRFNYNVYLIQHLFKKKKMLPSLGLFMKTLFRSPADTFRFYKSRLFSGNRLNQKI